MWVYMELNTYFPDVFLFYGFNMQNILKKTVKSSLSIAALMLLTANYGCVKNTAQDVALEIQNVQPVSGKGIYNVVGNTNLPESSQISIMAVRYLRPSTTSGEESLKSPEVRKRSILARQNVEVKQGKWEAQLNLLQVAADGSFQEVWQENQGQTQLVADSGVTFIATFYPSSQIQASEESISSQKPGTTQPLDGPLVRFTNEGEKYVQASQTLLISLPESKTKPPLPRAEDVNGGWGNRYQTQPQTLVSGANPIPVIKYSQTNSRLSRAEFLR
jgi:hypothetical protein